MRPGIVLSPPFLPLFSCFLSPSLRWIVPARQKTLALFTSGGFLSILLPHAYSTTSCSHHRSEQRLRPADRGDAGAQELSSLRHNAQCEGPQLGSGARNCGTRRTRIALLANAGARRHGGRLGGTRGGRSNGEVRPH